MSQLSHRVVVPNESEVLDEGHKQVHHKRPRSMQWPSTDNVVCTSVTRTSGSYLLSPFVHRDADALDAKALVQRVAVQGRGHCETQRARGPVQLKNTGMLDMHGAPARHCIIPSMHSRAHIGASSPAYAAVRTSVHHPQHTRPCARRCAAAEASPRACHSPLNARPQLANAPCM